jgi:CHAT domain-containing protein/Flp pilus assembly protein TadD
MRRIHGSAHVKRYVSRLIVFGAILAAGSSVVGSGAGRPRADRLDTYNTGMALLDAGLNQKAAQLFENALRDNGAFIELAGGLIEARSRLCAPNAAIAYCAQTLDRTTGAHREIFRLYLDGEKARVQRDFKGAAAQFRGASDAAGQEKDTLATVVCVEALVQCLLANQDADGALESARRLGALSSSGAVAERLRAGSALVEAECLNGKDRIGGADSLYRLVLSLASARGFRRIESGCLSGVGRVEEKRQRFTEARSHYEQALSLEQAMGDKEDAAILLNNLAQVEVNTGALDAAAARFTQCEVTAEACGLRWILGYIYYGRGAIAEAKGDKEGALKLFQQSLALHTEQNNVWGELGAQLRLGYLWSALGDYAKAGRHYEHALKIYEDMKSLYGMGWALAGLAVNYHKLGDFEKAQEYYRRTLEVKRKLGDKRGTAWALNSLGGIADMQGRYREALSLEHEAMTIYEETGDRPGFGDVHYSMGSVYFYLGNYAEALKHYEAAFTVATETGDQRFLGRVVSGMGSAYSSAGRADLAEGLYRKCLEIARASKEETEIVWALNNLASLYIQLKDFVPARNCLEESLARLPREGQDYMRARALYLLGMAGGPTASSIAYLERALALADGSGLEELRWKCLSDLGELYYVEGDTAKSYSLQHRAILAVESLRRLAGSDELRRHFLEPAILPYERIVSLTLSGAGRASDVKEAFGYTERCRAQILASLLREAMSRTGAKEDDRFLEREREILSQLTFYQVRLQDGTITPGERTGLLGKIDGLEQSFVNLGTKLERGDRSYVAALYPKVEQPEDLLSALAPGERMLSFFLGADRSYVFCGTGTELTVHELPAKEAIERRIDYFLSILQQTAAAPGDTIPREVLDSASSELFNMLLGPVAKELGPGERLLIIPDGLLNRLPFALLRGGGRYLVEDHDISYAPSMRTLRYLRERNAVRSRSKRVNEYGIIAIGASGESVAGPKDGSRVYPYTDIPVEPLPRAAEEAKEVASIFDRSLVLAGRSALESAFKGSRLEDTGILHVAAHAYVDNDDLRRSFVVLNPERSFEDTLAGPSEDGILQWHEIAGLRLNAALVTLAACRTAGGVLSRGEGISGLTEAFLYSGAGCVLAAQFDVPDALSGEMMVEYYRGIRHGLGAAAALSAAQRAALARSDALGRPAVWGAYVAIGDGASAPRLSSGLVSSRHIAGLLIVVAAVASVLILVRRHR